MKPDSLASDSSFAPSRHRVSRFPTLWKPHAKARRIRWEVLLRILKYRCLSAGLIFEASFSCIGFLLRAFAPSRESFPISLGTSRIVGLTGLFRDSIHRFPARWAGLFERMDRWSGRKSKAARGRQHGDNTLSNARNPGSLPATSSVKRHRTV